MSKYVAKAFKDEIDWVEVLTNALFVAIVLKKNYLAIEEYFFCFNLSETRIWKKI